MQETSMRRATAWTPARRRHILHGPKHCQPGHGDVLREPGDMAAAIIEHWRPMFEAASCSEHAVHEC
eukprot:1633533-Pyramimonas_sp.AAC.1